MSTPHHRILELRMREAWFAHKLRMREQRWMMHALSAGRNKRGSDMWTCMIFSHWISKKNQGWESRQNLAGSQLDSGLAPAGFQVEKYVCFLPIRIFSRYLSLPPNFSATHALVDLRMACA